MWNAFCSVHVPLEAPCGSNTDIVILWLSRDMRLAIREQDTELRGLILLERRRIGTLDGLRYVNASVPDVE
jgi:hypothetical protein